jgi:hypothetical protein
VITLALLGLGACTQQPTAEVTPPSLLSCDGAHATSIDVLWTRYFQAAAQSGTGGCALMSCHGGVQGGGGMRFSNAAEFVAETVNVRSMGDSSLMRIKMKDPADSYLFQRLLPEAGERRMPPSGPYLDDQGLMDTLGWICGGDVPDAGVGDAGAALDLGPHDASAAHPIVIDAATHDLAKRDGASGF